MRIVVDFRVLNEILKRLPCYIEPIETMLATVGIFEWASHTYLNMGYYSMKLCEATRKFVRIVTIWGIYEFQVLAMGSAPASDIFQRRVTNRLSSVRPVPPKVYIDDILVALLHTFKEHIQYLDEILTIIGEAGLQVNMKKLAFCQKELEFVGFWIMTNGYKPLQSRIQEIQDIRQPTNVKQVRIFIGMVNFIKNHIPRRAEVIQPLTELTKGNVLFEWDNRCEEAFG